MYFLFAIYHLNNEIFSTRYKYESLDDALSMLGCLQHMYGDNLAHSIYYVDEEGISDITDDDLRIMGYEF